MILAAQHMRHFHKRVVDGIAEKECRGPFSATNDEVADIVGGNSLRPALQSVEAHHRTVVDAEAQSRAYAFVDTLLPLVATELRAGAGVTRGPARGELRLVRQLQFALRTKAGVGMAARYQHNRKKTHGL